MSLFQRLARIKEKAPGGETPSARVPTITDFPGGREESTPFGPVYLIEGQYPGSIAAPAVAPDRVCANLQLLYGVGPVTEGKLKDCGYADLQHLKEHDRWGSQAAQALQIIEASDIRALRRLGARDVEILPYFPLESLVFLDIETTGLWASQPLFLVGILAWQNGQLVARQFLARRLTEERALLAALIQELSGYALVVTFNGKQFDIPYIEGRTVEHRLFYKCRLEQIDLLFHARRHFRGKLPDCRLTTLEEHLLGSRREGDVPGSLIPEIYYRFVRSQDPALIRDILRHNILDLLAMAKLFYLVSDRLQPDRPDCQPG